ncbi:hypothetical protein [Rubritalea marina]|uniref:hypothetical protein n=1 Tax=Rubritalea marina TaxID=361055 RepID=UPI0003653409|nr:hypothetical protein [Rubritalea marina]
MKFVSFSFKALLLVFAASSVSCNLPESEKDLGPTSEHSAIPWNRRLPGEGQGVLGGFSQ